MKTIHIFLASSEELRLERNEFSDLILQLNDLFERRGVRIKLIRWEHLDSSMGVEHKQQEYNDRLRECEMCLALYWTKFGEYTRSELETAYTELKAGRNPRKLYVFFKDTDEITPELRDFKESFANKYGHFYCRFENVDTMRLHFLLQLEAHPDMGSQERLLTVEKEKIKIDGHEFADLNNLSFACGNEGFRRMKERLGELSRELTEVRMAQAAAPDDDTLWEKAIDLAGERKKLAEEFEQHQNFLLGMALQFARITSERCTERMERARELFESGRASEANQVLDAEQMQHDAEHSLGQWEQAQHLAEECRQGILACIAEFLLKTSTAMSDTRLSIPERFTQACEAYDQAIALACKVGYENDKLGHILLDYARLSENFNAYDKSRKLYEEALDIFRKLAVDNPDTYLYNIAGALNGLATQHQALNRHDQALGELQEASEILQKLAENDPECFLSDIASVANNRGRLYAELDKHMQALLEYATAQQAFTALCSTDPLRYAQKLVLVTNNMASSLIIMERYKIAEAALTPTLKLCRKMAAKDPERHLPDVAMLLTNQAILHQAKGESELAEAERCETLEIHRKLAVINPCVYLPKVAHSLNMQGFSHQDSAPEQSEAEHTEALRIYRRLVASDPQAYLPGLAYTFRNLGLLHTDSDTERAENEYTEALTIYRRLSAVNAEPYLSEIAMLQLGMAILHDNPEDFDKALSEFSEAFEIYRKLSLQNPGTHRPYMADIQQSIGTIYNDYVQDYSKAEEAYAKAVAIYTRLARKPEYAEKLQEAQQKLQSVIGKQTQQE